MMPEHIDVPKPRFEIGQAVIVYASSVQGTPALIGEVVQRRYVRSSPGVFRWKYTVKTMETFFPSVIFVGTLHTAVEALLSAQQTAATVSRELNPILPGPEQRGLTRRKMVIGGLVAGLAVAVMVRAS